MKRLLFLVPLFLVLIACQQGVSYKQSAPAKKVPTAQKEVLLIETPVVESPSLVATRVEVNLPPTLPTAREKSLPLPESSPQKLSRDDLILSTTEPKMESNMTPPLLSKESLSIEKIDPLEIIGEEKKEEKAEEVEAEEVIEKAPETPLDDALISTFEYCDDLSGFSNYVWYWTLLTKIHEENKFNDFDPIMADENVPTRFNQKKINASDVTQICASFESGLVLVLLAGDRYGNGFHLYQYHRDTQELTDAGRIVTQDQVRWALTPETFGKRVEREVALSGKMIKNRCTHRGSFLYDYVDNQIRLAKTCTLCPGETQPSCLNYGKES